MRCGIHKKGTAQRFAEDFWAKVKREPGKGCWNWTGYKLRGYGRLSTNGNGISLIATRVSWILANGPIPPGNYVLHECDNPPCVRPSHLFLGTQKDNIQDMIRKRGPSHAKLTQREVLGTILQLAMGTPPKQIAKQFGVTRETIYRIKNGHTWKHLSRSV